MPRRVKIDQEDSANLQIIQNESRNNWCMSSPPAGRDAFPIVALFPPQDRSFQAASRYVASVSKFLDTTFALRYQ